VVMNKADHLKKASEYRSLAKFYGGKALQGYPKEKAEGERVRMKFLESEATSFEQKQNLLSVGGFTDHSKFWIDNKHIKPSLMTAESIASQWSRLVELRATHEDTLCRTGLAIHKDAARKEINALRESLDFNFQKAWGWEQ